MGERDLFPDLNAADDGADDLTTDITGASLPEDGADAGDEGASTTTAATDELAPPSGAPQAETPRHIPLAGYLDEREKRQQAQRERDELKARLEAMERQQSESRQQPQTPQVQSSGNPDLDNYIFNAVTLPRSRYEAEREFGSDEVEKAIAFFDTSAVTIQMSHALKRSPHPVRDAVMLYRKEMVAQEVGDIQTFRQKVIQESEPEMRARLRAEWEAEQAALVQAQPAPTPTRRPPVSLASAPGANRGAPVTSADLVKDVFGPRSR